MEKRVLCSVLCVQRRVCEVTVNSALLAWRETHTGGKRSGRAACGAGGHCVPVCEIIAVQEQDEDSSKYTGTWQKVPQSPSHCYRHAFTASRPKHLLVYINPYGGKRRGKQIYDQKVAPIFSRASISTSVIVTEHANHARDHLKTEADLKKYDGVVCVGGDGMFSEVMHGLISRTQRDAGLDENSQQILLPCRLRIGIIPAGSTDCICYATVGSNDPVTSALHIVVGDSQPMDVSSVHNETLLRYSVSLLGYGFYGDVLTDSERKRWAGPARYDISGFKTFLSHRCYEGTISFVPANGNLGNPRDKTQCRSGCITCRQSSSEKLLSKDKPSIPGAVSERQDKWTVIRGKFVAINAASMSCACPRSPKGLSPSAHLADGTADLILVRKCSRLHFLRHLLRHTSKDDQFDHSFVEVYRVTRFCFTPRHQECDSELDLTQDKRFFSQICRDHRACSYTPAQSNWNCDGEILPHTAIQVRVHCQLITLFARGIEQQSVFEEPFSLCAV